MLCLIQQPRRFFHPQLSSLHHSHQFLIKIYHEHQGPEKLVINVLVSSERLVGRFSPTETLSSLLAPPSADENSKALYEVVNGSLDPSKMMVGSFAVLLKLSRTSLDPCEATLDPSAAPLGLSGASSKPFGASSPWKSPPPNLPLHREFGASAGMNWADHGLQWRGQQYLEEPAWATCKAFGGSSNPGEGRISSIFQGMFSSASTLPRPLSSA